ncbi:TRAP transporter small permease subunit [Alphaproteobacteria bacterium HT1-32]|nr:TRAP transporter small permease subunit [Alphaproteobacteria bacterium HT1-32]
MHTMSQQPDKPGGPLNTISRWLVAVSGVALVAMMLHIVADISLKYLFRHPIPGTTEIVSAIYMVSIVFLPLMAVTLIDSHISVEFFTKFLKPSTARRLNAVVLLITFIIVSVFFFAAFDQALRKTASGESWETADGYIAIWYSRWLVPVGIGFCAIAFGRNLLRAIAALRKEQP